MQRWFSIVGDRSKAVATWCGCTKHLPTSDLLNEIRCISVISLPRGDSGRVPIERGSGLEVDRNRGLGKHQARSDRTPQPLFACSGSGGRPRRNRAGECPVSAGSVPLTSTAGNGYFRSSRLRSGRVGSTSSPSIESEWRARGETNLSAESNQAVAQARVPRPNEDPRGSGCSQAPPAEEPEAALRLRGVEVVGERVGRVTADREIQSVRPATGLP